MSLKFVIGRAGSGKTQYCLDEVRQRLKEDPAGPPLILLVPEQATFQAEYELVTTPGLNGTMRAQAISFRRLAYRVMQECGGTARIHIDDTGKQMLLYKILQAHKEELAIFGGSVEQQGFVAELNELFTEFRRYDQSATDLDDIYARAARLETADSDEGFAEGFDDDEHNEAANPFLHKLQDLKLIYGKFEEQLAGHYIDSEDYLQTLADQAPKSNFLREAELWIDGFDGFTPQEFSVIGQLMRSVKRVTMTLCIDRPYEPGEQLNELHIFYQTAETMMRMKELAASFNVKLEPLVQLPTAPPRFQEAPMLAHLERHFADRHPPAYISGIELLPATRSRMQATSQVKIASAVHPRAELEYVARQILQLTQDGCRFRDIAVVTRNIETYGDLIETTFTDHGIPFFMDHKKTVLHHPAIELIRSAIEVAVHHWRYDAVFRCVKTDLISADRHAMDELENYVLAFGLEGSRWTDSQRWEYVLRTSLDEDEPDVDADEALLDRIHSARLTVATPLQQFEKAFGQARNVREQVMALYKLLEALAVPQKLVAWSEAALAAGQPEKSKEHSGIWNQLIHLFDQIVEMLGEETMTGEQFGAMLDAGLDSMKLGLVPPSIDQVLVGTLDRTRFGAVRHAFVIGVNDGVIPAQLKEGSILSEAERESAAKLGMELAPDSRRKLLDEQYLAYTGFTVASHGLWISYPLADEEGKSLLPSEYVHRIVRMFPDVLASPEFVPGEPSVLSDEALQADYLVHPERSLSFLLVQLRLWMGGSEPSPIWREALAWYLRDTAWRAKLERMLYSMSYTNQEQPLSSEISSLLYGSSLTASVSRMERFAACPFLQFASHGLRLKKRPVYRLEAPDIGQLFHAALNRMAQRMIEEGLRWRDCTSEQLFKLAEQAVSDIAPRLQSEILFSSERYQYMTRKLKDIVSRTAGIMGRHAKRSEFEPVALELGFGRGETLQPLKFELDNGALMELVGRIDRVDAAAHGERELLRVIDYKSGGKSLSLTEVYYGLSLQLLAYLDVVISQAEQWRGKPGWPAGALYFRVHNPLLQTEKPLSEQEREDELLKQYKMKGLVAADLDVIQAMDSELASGRSPIIPVGLKKDGDFFHDSQVADEAKWKGVRKLVRNKIKHIGNEILQGKVEIKPYKYRKKSPCDYCEYRPVCQFDIQMAANEYRYLPDIGKDELWQRILEQKEEG